MGMGQELKDFVGAFKTGYDMFDSKEEKAQKKEDREWKKQDREWMREDTLDRRNYRDKAYEHDISREAVGDQRYDDTTSYNRGRDAAADKRADDTTSYNRGRDDKTDARQAALDKYNQAQDAIKRHDEQKAAGIAQGHWEAEQQLQWEKTNLELRRLAAEAAAASKGINGSVVPDPYAGEPAAGDKAIPEHTSMNMYNPSRKPSDAAIPDGTGGATVQNASYNPSASDVATGNDVPWLQYANQGATRNKPLSDHLTKSLSFLPELGVQMKVFSGGQEGDRRTGSHRHDHGDAADAFFYKDGKRLDWKRPEDRPVFEEIVKRAKDNGLTGFGAGDGYMQPGSMHLGFGDPAVWGKNGKRDNAPNWLVNAYSGTQSLASGGVVGAIPDGSQPEEPDQYSAINIFSDPPPEEQPQEALPVSKNAPAYDGAMDGDKEAPTNDPFEEGRRAVRDGLKRALSKTGADANTAMDDPEVQKGREAYIRGYGAAPEQVVKQVIDKIDPDRKMAAGERNMRAMATVYKFYNDKGEPDKAKEAAASMLQYYRQSSQQFMALAHAAGQAGDWDKATKAAIAAYTNIPNGRDMSVKKLSDDQYEINVTDARTGKVVNRKVMDPKRFGEIAMGFGPNTFDDEILNAAGAPADKMDDIAPDKMAELESGTSAIAADVLGNSPLNDEQKSAITSIASGMQSVNTNRMGPDQSVRFAQSLVSLDMNDQKSDKKNYTAKPVRGNPDFVDVTSQGRTVRMPKNAFAQLESLHGKFSEDRTTSNTKAEKSAEWWQQQGDLARKAAKSFGEAFTENSPTAEGQAALATQNRDTIAPVQEKQSAAETSGDQGAISRTANNTAQVRKLMQERDAIRELPKTPAAEARVKKIEAQIKELTNN